MRIDELRQSPGAKSPRKRRGRGIAAGQGKTAGFGTKGQGSRAGRGGHVFFEGGQNPMVRRLAHKRGFRNVTKALALHFGAEMVPAPPVCPALSISCPNATVVNSSV